MTAYRPALAMLIVFAFALSIIPAQADSACCICPKKAGHMVERYRPVIVQEDDIPAKPEAMLFRVATDEECATLKLAYHVVWPYEEDPRTGFWPAVTRATYTGGLKLQKLIYGPGDTEVIEIHVDIETGDIKRVRYETAEYDKKGNVVHVEVIKEGAEAPEGPTLAFKVISWNHLFDMMDEVPDDGDGVYRFAPGPFTDELWDRYKMTKKHESPLRRDRDHPDWEDGEICRPPESPCGCRNK